MEPPSAPTLRRATAVPGVLWPSIAKGTTADRLRDLLEQLEDSQWWPEEQVRVQQFRQLGALLMHCAREMPFYRDRLAAAGFRPGEKLTPEIWDRLPILTRSEVQAAGDALAATRVPTGHGGTSVVHTSGSTGTPVTVTKTAMAGLLWHAFLLRDHRWHRRDLSLRFAAIRAMEDGVGLYPAGTRARNWSPATALVQPTGPGFGLSIRATTAEQLEWLNRVRPDYLLSYPSALAALADFARRGGGALPPLVGLMSFGEACSDEARAACREACGLRIADCYTTQEVGYIALECPEREGSYHVQSEGVLVEVLDADGRPCAPGETGRLVATPLHNFAMPLLRYEVGDLAEVGPPCPCGRDMPVLSRVGGRARHLLRLPGGDTLWPRLRVGTYRDIAPIRQFQLAQLALDRLEFRVVVERPLTEAEEEELRRRLRERLDGRPFRIDIVYSDAIPRSAGGKYEDVRCEISDTIPAR